MEKRISIYTSIFAPPQLSARELRMSSAGILVHDAGHRQGLSNVRLQVSNNHNAIPRNPPPSSTSSVHPHNVWPTYIGAHQAGN